MWNELLLITGNFVKWNIELGLEKGYFGMGTLVFVACADLADTFGMELIDAVSVVHGQGICLFEHACKFVTFIYFDSKI
jgi:hypothetical protein